MAKGSRGEVFTQMPKRLELGGTQPYPKKGPGGKGNVNRGGTDAEGTMPTYKARQNGTSTMSRLGRNSKKGPRDSGATNKGGGTGMESAFTGKARNNGTPTSGNRPSSYKSGYKAKAMERQLRGKTF